MNFLTISYPWYSTQLKEVEYKYIETNLKNTFMMKADPRFTLNTTLKLQQQDHQTNIKE